MKTLFKYRAVDYSEKCNDDIFSIEILEDRTIICRRYNMRTLKEIFGVYEEKFTLSKAGFRRLNEIIDEFKEFQNLPSKIKNNICKYGIRSFLTINDHTVQVDNIIRTKADIKKSQLNLVDLESNLYFNKIMHKIQSMFYADDFYCWYSDYLSLKYKELKYNPLRYSIIRFVLQPSRIHINELIRVLWYYNPEVLYISKNNNEHEIFCGEGKSGTTHYLFDSAIETIDVPYLAKKCNAKKLMPFRELLKIMLTDKNFYILSINPLYGYEIRLSKDYLIRQLKSIISKDAFAELEKGCEKPTKFIKGNEIGRKTGYYF